MLSSFDKFLIKFKESFKKENNVICNVLENVFSMRVIGNKTHGDLAEVALTEYINSFVDGYSAKHTGKEKFRAKEFEEDINVTDESTDETFPISIKAYGVGPLQLSTNKDASMFKYLTYIVGKDEITDFSKIKEIMSNKCFIIFQDINILPLIYSEKEMTFKIIIYNLRKAYSSIRKIKYIPSRKLGKNRKTYPIYKFYDKNNRYIFEVRYGDASANALQRGMWTHTENADQYFDKILSGLYKINQPLIKLVSKILVSPQGKHIEILKKFF